MLIVIAGNKASMSETQDSRDAAPVKEASTDSNTAEEVLELLGNLREGNKPDSEGDKPVYYNPLSEQFDLGVEGVDGDYRNPDNVLNQLIDVYRKIPGSDDDYLNEEKLEKIPEYVSALQHSSSSFGYSLDDVKEVVGEFADDLEENKDDWMPE